MSYFRQRLSPIKPGTIIDYKDVELLRRFITERGKILPRRITGLTSQQQRDLTKAIKRARILALLPFINKEG
ncbi:MAG: 30S ribosomal protein S18 [Symploca sp. SIO2G7]|nr:30S ribosomal protein S18 [Symploca sp. SIO2G7]